MTLLLKKQITHLQQNCEEFGIPLANMDHPDQGIVHIIGPELGLTQPGKTIVCGDSHTSTHGAFGAIAFGIGTSEVEHVLSTQTLWQAKPKTMEDSSDRRTWIWCNCKRHNIGHHFEVWNRYGYRSHRRIYW